MMSGIDTQEIVFIGDMPFGEHLDVLRASLKKDSFSFCGKQMLGGSLLHSIKGLLKAKKKRN